MRTIIKKRSPEETGSGLVELLVAMAIIVMIVVGTAMLMARIIGFQESAESLDKGVQVARDYLERAKSVDFNRLGFHETDPGFMVSGPNGEPTVILPLETATAGLLPIDTKVVGKTEYQIRLHITQSDPDDIYSPKRVTIEVSWLDDQRQEQKTTVGILRTPSMSEMIPPGFDLSEIPSVSGAPSAPTYFEENFAGIWSANFNYSRFTVGVVNTGEYPVDDIVFEIQCPSGTPVTVYWSAPDDGWTASGGSGTGFYSLQYTRSERPDELICHIEDATTNIIAINEAGISPPLTVTYDNFMVAM